MRDATPEELQAHSQEGTEVKQLQNSKGWLTILKAKKMLIEDEILPMIKSPKAADDPVKEGIDYYRGAWFYLDKLFLLLEDAKNTGDLAEEERARRTREEEEGEPEEEEEEPGE